MKINNKLIQNVVDITDNFIKKFDTTVVKAIYIPTIKIVILNFDVRNITGNGEKLILGINKYKPNGLKYDVCYGSAGSTGYVYVKEDGLYRLTGSQNMLAGTIIYTTDK